VLAHLPQTRATLEQAVDLRLAARPCLAPLGEYAKWLELSREAEPMARELNDPRREVLVHCSMTSALSVMGRSAEAIGHGEHALAIAETLQEPTLRIVARYSLGLSYTLVGDFRAAVRYYQREVGLDSEQIGDWLLGSWGAGTFTETFTRINYSITQSISAVCFAELGAFDQALLLAERGARFAQALNILYVRAIADAALGFVHLRKGDAQTALQSARRWLQVYPAADLPFPRLVMAATLGEVFNVTGQLDEGIALLEEAWRFAESRDLLAWGQPVLALLSDAHGRAGRSEQAVATGQRALDLARQMGQPGWEASTLYLLGDIHCHGALASTSQPRECYEQALLLARELAMRPLEAQCHLALGEVAIEAGDKHTASEQLATAASMFRDMDMRSRVEKTESALERI